MLSAITPKLRGIFIPGRRYKKSGVLFFGLESEENRQIDLFADTAKVPFFLIDYPLLREWVGTTALHLDAATEFVSFFVALHHRANAILIRVSLCSFENRIFQDWSDKQCVLSLFGEFDKGGDSGNFVNVDQFFTGNPHNAHRHIADNEADSG